MSAAEIDEGVFETTATIDNGSFGTRTIRFETGRLALQAAGAVVAYLDDDNMLLSATTASKNPKEHFDFFPLTVDVEERMYAAGRIPGSFFRREGRPSTDAILTCRLIDRPLRPSFVDGLRNEIQIVVTILSLDPGDLYDVLAINAASASTQLGGLPFSGPIGGVRVALIDGTWVGFPTVDQIERAVFDMVVAGRIVEGDVAIMMVEAEATENVVELVEGGAQAPTESVVAAGLEAAKPFIAALCTAQQELADAAGKSGKPTVDFPVFPDYGEDVYYSVSSVATDELAAALTIGGKAERDQRIDEIKTQVVQRLADTYEGREKEVGAALRALTKKLVRQRILTDHFRIDGRGITDIRALSAEVAVVPRAHGSALFERGETQILGVTTLDMIKMAQQIDSLGPETSKRYMHHYNFPPFSTGETGRVGSPKRREIGHGALAERALVPVLPSVEEFPYAIRQVSEALGSNGSTSMGSVCASTLALLNAGVPLKAPVAGIAMGLVSDDIQVEGAVDGVVERRFVTLTDILGAEDAFGDMDFKVAGTKDFVTALQLDTKLDGIPSQVLAGALEQAKDARLTILEVMAEAIDRPDEMSPYAPRVTTIKVPVDKIGEVIGPKGKVINAITEETGAQISIEDDGTVFVGATDGPSAQAAIDKINAIANPQLPTVGERFLGTVVKTTDFGAFVSLLPGRDGLVHISKLGKGKRIAKVEDVVNVGDKLRVEIADIDKRGKISLILVADEGATVAGAAHFLEHLLFKSTPTRSAVDIAQAMDAVGGELNAFTAKEHTCYYAHVLGSDLPLAVDLVADVVLNGRCAADDVEVERDVVLEEIAMRDDDPEDALADMFLAALFGDHPVGRPVIGSAQSVSVMTRAQLQSFHLRRYTPERMVVAAAGNVDHDGLVALVREHFGSRLVRGRRPVAPRKGTGRVNGSPRLTLVSRDAEQTHVSLGIRTPGRGWEHRWALSVLHTALGGGLSSRLFQEVRETRGLAYSVYSALDLFADSGALSVYAACLPERFADVMRVTADVLESVARDGITEAECGIAKGSLRGGLVLGLEDSSSRMSRLGRSELNYGKHRSIEHTLRQIEQVTVEEVNAVARHLLSRRYGAAVLGPHGSKRSLPQQLRAMVG